MSQFGAVSDAIFNLSAIGNATLLAVRGETMELSPVVSVAAASVVAGQEVMLNTTERILQAIETSRNSTLATDAAAALIADIVADVQAHIEAGKVRIQASGVEWEQIKTKAGDEWEQVKNTTRAAANREWQKVKNKTLAATTAAEIEWGKVKEKCENEWEKVKSVTWEAKVAAEKEWQQILQQTELYTEWEKVKNKTYAAKVAAEDEWQRVRDNTAAVGEKVYEGLHALKEMATLSEDIFDLKQQGLGVEIFQGSGNGTEEQYHEAVEMQLAVREKIDAVIKRLQAHNSSMTHAAANALSDVFQRHGDVSVIPLLVFIVSAMICLGASAACHLYFALSHNYYVWMSRMDYTGITILIAGSFFPPVFYGLHCSSALKWSYIICILLMAFLTICALMNEKYAGPEYTQMRTSLFVGLGLFGLVPVGQHFITYGMTDMAVHLLTMAALYLLGTVFYVMKIPERWWPGCFDYFGNSHLIWHLLVLSAALVHYKGSMGVYMHGH